MSDYRSPPADPGQPVMWQPHDQAQNTDHMTSQAPSFGQRSDYEQPSQPHFDPRRAANGRATQPTSPYGYQSYTDAPSYPVHVEHVAPSGALSPPAPNAPAPLLSSENKPSLMERMKNRASEDPTVPNSSNRKPFLIGVLTGAVGMLLLGQVFGAATSGSDYSYVPPSVIEPDSASPEGEDPDKALTFLDQVEQANPS